MITVADIEALVKTLAEKRLECEELKKPLTKANEELEAIEQKLVEALDEVGKDSYKSESGTVTRVNKWRVNLPQGEDKLKFFEFLKERNLFEGMATVNSNSLNAFFMEEWENAKKGDPMAALNFSLPGIGEPKAYKTLSFRRK